MTTGTKERPLTVRQEKFCAFYFKTRDATQAAIQAGYAPLYAGANCDKLLKNTKIAQRISEMATAIKLEAIADVTERKERLTKLLRANLVDFIDGDEPTLSRDIRCHEAAKAYSVKTTYTKKGDPIVTRSITLTDPVAAIAELNKMERVGAVDTQPVSQDNRVLIINVNSDNAKSLIDKLAGRLNATE